MERERIRNILNWVLVVANLVAGVLFLLAAFGVGATRGELRPLFLAIGLVCLVAGGAWLLSGRFPKSPS
jgi:hypothetical protein